MICGKTSFTEHALNRMFERQIGRTEVREIAERVFSEAEIVVAKGTEVEIRRFAA
jgi:hypothetical protein